MKLILPYFIIIIVLLQLCLKKNSKNYKKSLDDFLEKEARANSVRKKDISMLDYITIPEELSLPETENRSIVKEWNTIQSLKTKKILNLTGYTNTELKLQYGAANLTALTACDNHFTMLSQAVAKIGELLLQEGFTPEAVAFLEFGIRIQTDISKNYTLLAQHYADCGSPEKIDLLITQAKQLKSLMKDSIISNLNTIKSKNI